MFVYFQLFVYFSQISCLEASDAETAQSKDVWNENLKFLRWSVVYLLSALSLLLAVCLLFQISHLEASDSETAKSKDVWNENLEFLMSAVYLLSAVCLLFSNKPLRGFCSDTETAQSKDVWNKNLEF